MRINRPMVTGTVLAIATLSVLAGCGTGYGPAARTASGQVGVSALGALDEPDLPLDKLPDERLYVPDAPTRRPQSPTSRNDAKLFVSPAETLPALKAMIAGAEKSIYIEVFNFGNDSMGRQIAPLLEAQAKAGLEVKVVMDYIGSRFLKGHKDLVDELREAGVEVRSYRPRAIWKDNHRLGVNITHRKVYLVDGKTALIGGVNLMAPFDTTTQDALIQWRGPVVGQLYSEFAHDWHAAHGKTLYQQPVTGAAGDTWAQVVVTSPGEARFEARDAFYDAVDSAKDEILIEQQYLCDDRMIDHLHQAVARGVKLRTITPGPEHGFVFNNVHMLELKKLTEEGAQARLYRNFGGTAHLHTKFMAVDDRWAVLGSTNCDTRGFIENNELSIVTTDRELVRDMRQRIFEADWAQHSTAFEYKDSWVLKPVRTLLELIDYYL